MWSVQHIVYAVAHRDCFYVVAFPYKNYCLWVCTQQVLMTVKADMSYTLMKSHHETIANNVNTNLSPVLTFSAPSQLKIKDLGEVNPV